MAIITTQTLITIGDAPNVLTTTDLVLQVSDFGSLALRQLIYPDATIFAPITYFNNPDTWTNFDLAPMVKRPSVASLRTLTDTKLTGWQGYAKDVPITETWRGSSSTSSMSIDFFRILYNYFENPPATGLIQWAPRDRTTTVYNILIESLTAGGSEVSFDFLAARQGCILGDVVLRFRIVSEA